MVVEEAVVVVVAVAMLAAEAEVQPTLAVGVSGVVRVVAERAVVERPRVCVHRLGVEPQVPHVGRELLIQERGLPAQVQRVRSDLGALKAPPARIDQ